MAEEIEQNAFVHKVEWPMLGLAVVIFIVGEELIRHFAYSGGLETFISCCLGLTFSNYISEKSKGIARDALQAITISAAVGLAFFVLPRALRNFMPVAVAYGLPIFLMVMANYIFDKLIGRQTNIYNYLKVGLIMAVLAGALGALLR
jgi:hypothetical protein